MNLTTLKLLIWIAALGALGYLGFFVYAWAIMGKQDELTRTRAPHEFMKRVLDEVPEPEPPRTTLVDYERVVATFHEMNWTGAEAPPPPPPPPPQAEEPTTRPKPVVAKLLRVLYVEVDTDAPADSLALIVYDNADLSRTHPGAVPLKIGDRLHGAFSGVRVHAIQPEGLAFVVDDFEDDGPERVAIWSPYGPGIVYVGEGGAQLPSVVGIPQAPLRIIGRPERTVERRPNTFVLGTQDVERFEADYLDILSNEVRHRQYRDPRTGKWEGVEVLHVEPGSAVAQHGVKTGDIVKSINGTSVNSVSQAISYVKNNQDLYTVWEVVVSNAGKDRTLIYESNK